LNTVDIYIKILILKEKGPGAMDGASLFGSVTIVTRGA